MHARTAFSCRSFYMLLQTRRESWKTFFAVYDKIQSLNTRIIFFFFFFFNRPITYLQREHKAATNGTSASKREATGYHTPQSFNALSAAIRATVNRLRHSVRARLLSFRWRDATRGIHAYVAWSGRLHRPLAGSKRRHVVDISADLWNTLPAHQRWRLPDSETARLGKNASGSSTNRDIERICENCPVAWDGTLNKSIEWHLCIVSVDVPKLQFFTLVTIFWFDLGSVYTYRRLEKRSFPREILWNFNSEFNTLSRYSRVKFWARKKIGFVPQRHVIFKRSFFNDKMSRP